MKMTLPTIDDVSPRSDTDAEEAAFSKRGCCFCFRFGGRGSPASGGSVFWERIDGHYEGSNPETPTIAPEEDSWWVRGWKKLREWSEIIAGPKWKTLIRRLANKRKQEKLGKQGGKFHYDPLSYSLNFDDGLGGHGSQFDDDFYFSRGFSSRFSLPPSAKSSMDFDKEGITFT